MGIKKATQHALLLGAGAFGPSIRGKLHLGMEASAFPNRKSSLVVGPALRAARGQVKGGFGTATSVT